MSTEGEGDGAATGKGGDKTAAVNNELSLTSLVERDDTTRLAALPNDRPNSATDHVPDNFFLSKEEYYQKLTKIGFEENLGSAQRIRETDPEKIAKAIQHGDIIKIDNTGKSVYYRVMQDASGQKWVTGDGKNFDPLTSVLKDNQEARIMRAPRKMST